MVRNPRIPKLAVAAVLVLGGCSMAREPFEQPGTWQATGANEHNLRAMVAVPGHLDRGIGAATERSQPGTLAATRLLTDRRRRLPVTTTSGLFAAGAGGGDAPVTGPGAGGAGASR
ncbi:hypothetical protein GCM10010964_33750 [Caldovatus sediminis]|jgi:hypothetical protein|uniref:Lipoprotein n=1 Tax=Caldovatus sediminis TaxID=2041189 RepID=A0A8J2ZDP2_9PROT|nr:hypothetical protein [Caldovatus sediminis]GGG43588.1 hypothetical protein GCM10010964_33750 [Caldovatus sediminis]